MPGLLQNSGKALNSMEKNKAEASILGTQIGGGKLSQLGLFALGMTENPIHTGLKQRDACRHRTSCRYGVTLNFSSSLLAYFEGGPFPNSRWRREGRRFQMRGLKSGWGAKNREVRGTTSGDRQGRSHGA